MGNSNKSGRFAPRFFGLALIGALASVSLGCASETDTEPSDEEVGESEGELKSNCVQSKFNCGLPAHPHSDKDSNRFFNGNSIHWSVEPGTSAFDGNGVRIGTVDSQIEINYGQRKSINGKNHVLGFSFKLTSGTAVSGWIEESRVKGDTSKMPTVIHHKPGLGDGESFVIDGGNPAKYKDAQGRNLKISSAGVGNLEANDYLSRPGVTIHLLYSVPGFQIGGSATDTFFVLGKSVVFTRTKGVKAISVPTHSVSGAAGPSMAFMFGHVGGRYGWIPSEALSSR